MAIMVSSTYQFLANIIPEIKNPPHYVEFSEREAKGLERLADRLEKSRSRSHFVNAGNASLKGEGFQVRVTATMVEVQESPKESLKIINGFHRILKKHSVPPKWYSSLGEVVTELGLEVSKDLKQAITYGQSMKSNKEFEEYLVARGRGRISMNWKELKAAGETEYLPF